MKIEFDGKISIEMPTEEELSVIYYTVKETMQREETLDLMAEIKERTDRMAAAEGNPNAFSSWSLIDKITWAVSEAYCIGYINGVKTAFQAFAEQVEDQAKEGGNN